MIREAREELGADIRLTGVIGEAIQYFYAGDRQCWYEMAATFFRGELVGPVEGTGEHELCWVEVDQPLEPFFHACHAWAARQARGH